MGIRVHIFAAFQQTHERRSSFRGASTQMSRNRPSLESDRDKGDWLSSRDRVIAEGMRGRSQWDSWVDRALATLARRKLLRSARPICVALPKPIEEYAEAIENFDGPGPWDRSSVEVEVEDETLRSWANDLTAVAPGENDIVGKVESSGRKKLLLFSGNDYLGLSSHPAVRKAAAETAQTSGMGPRGSALICGYTDYHKLLEASLADLKKKEDCLLCPTGFAANMAFMTAVGALCSLLSDKGDEEIAVFSDAFNHASIIDGIRIIQRQRGVQLFVYKHGNIAHLDNLLSSCRIEKKVVITDSLFSMDGVFAPMLELVQLRRKHKFLLAIDDAHGTFVCGENGGGVPELYGCEDEIDICIGTLSKAAGCFGGFIACSKRWRRLLESRGRSFIFSTALPVPVAAAAHAAVVVSKREGWRRRAIWSNVQDFSRLTKILVASHIISVILGSEESALQASRYMLENGFHVVAVRPPTVPPNSCRLRLTLSAAHSGEDIRRLADALLRYLDSIAVGRAQCQNAKL